MDLTLPARTCGPYAWRQRIGRFAAIDPISRLMIDPCYRWRSFYARAQGSFPLAACRAESDERVGPPLPYDALFARTTGGSSTATRRDLPLPFMARIWTREGSRVRTPFALVRDGEKALFVLAGRVGRPGWQRRRLWIGATRASRSFDASRASGDAILKPSNLASPTIVRDLASALVGINGLQKAPLEGFLLLFRSASSPTAARVARKQIAAIHHRTVEAAVRSKDRAAERAAIFLSLVAGLQMMRQIIGLPALAPIHLVANLRNQHDAIARFAAGDHSPMMVSDSPP